MGSVDIKHGVASAATAAKNRNVIHLVAREQEALIRINTFGGFSMQVNGRCARVYEWKGKKVHQLLISLTALGGKNVPVDSLADIIWPDAEGDKAMQNLEFSLRRLRNILQGLADDAVKGAQLILMHQGKLSLNPEYCSLDIWNWEQYCRQASQLRRQDEHQLAFDLETRACRLLQGEFLTGEDDGLRTNSGIWQQRCSNWITQMMAYWREDCIHAGHKDVMLLVDAGLRLDPGSEKLCMQTMHALLDEGYTVDALRAYYAWVQLIKDEYHLKPSIKLISMANRIHQH